MVVAAAENVFHEPGVAGPEYLLAPVAHLYLYLTLQMDDKPPLGQRMEIHQSQFGKLVDADLRDMHQPFQLGMLRQINFVNMAFPILCGVDTVYAHRDSFSPVVFIRLLQLSRLASSAA
jgi:hypothetical protein